MFGAKRQQLGTVYIPTHRKERNGWAPDRLWRFVDENKQLQLLMSDEQVQMRWIRKRLLEIWRLQT